MIKIRAYNPRCGAFIPDYEFYFHNLQDFLSKKEKFCQFLKDEREEEDSTFIFPTDDKLLNNGFILKTDIDIPFSFKQIKIFDEVEIVEKEVD